MDRLLTGTISDRSFFPFTNQLMDGNTGAVYKTIHSFEVSARTQIGWSVVPAALTLLGH